VVLNRIYTAAAMRAPRARNGERRKKYDLRIAAMARSTRSTAAIGVARLHTTDAAGSMPCLHASRTIVRSCGRLLLARQGQGTGRRTAAVTDAQVKRLEEEIDLLNAELEPLRTFVLAGARRRRRISTSPAPSAGAPNGLIVELKDQGESVSPQLMSYINRLSDFLFVASRFVNDKGPSRRAMGAGAEPVIR